MTRASVTLSEVSGFTDQQLIARLRDLVRTDRELGSRLLVHLGEVDARRLYREQAYSSMFAYCVEELHMSEGQAYVRIHAARLGRQFPLVVELFERGALHLSAIKLLGPHLTADNHAQVLERASFKGKREIELLVAELAPKPDVPNRMRKLPERSSAPAMRAQATGTLSSNASAARCVSDSLAAPTVTLLDARPLLALDACVSASPVTKPLAATPELTGSAAFIPGAVTQAVGATPALAASAVSVSASPVNQTFAATPALTASGASTAGAPVTHPVGATRALTALDTPVGFAQRIGDASVGAGPGAFVLERPRPRASSVPLRPGRYKVELTAGQALHDKLEQLQELLRHRVPDGDLAVIVELAVDALIDKTMKQRCARTQAPKKPRSNDHATSPRKVSSRYIPRTVVREVYARDGSRCTFVSSDGKRCSERGFLELHHHDVPFGRGGEPTADNMKLVCRAHNALFAERDYGVRFMRFKQLQARASRETKSLVPARVQV
jgi:hypothetical protein